MKRRVSIYNERTGLKFKPGHFSACIREARLRLGWTLKEASERTGISPSEIYKIENGNRECRLESLAHICAALGIPAGRLLDEITASEIDRATDLSASPSFQSLVDRCSIKDPGVAAAVAQNLRSCCGFGIQLLRCSCAARLARKVDYHGVLDLKTRFVAYAVRVDRIESSMERLEMVARINKDPVGFLIDYDLLSEEFIAAIAGAPPVPVFLGAGMKVFGKPDTIPTGHSIWVPTIPRSDAGGEMRAGIREASGLDNWKVSSDNSAVRYTWDNLRGRLANAAAKPGKKTAAADFVGVDQSNITRWIKDEREPGAEAAFRLLEWVTAEEAKQQSPGGALTPPEPKAQTEKRQDNEAKQSEPGKPSPGHKKKSTPRSHTKG